MAGKSRTPEKGSNPDRLPEQAKQAVLPTKEKVATTPEQQKPKLQRKLKVLKVLNVLLGRNTKLSNHIKGLELKLLQTTDKHNLNKLELEIIALSPTDSKHTTKEAETNINKAQQQAEKVVGLLETSGLAPDKIEQVLKLTSTKIENADVQETVNTILKNNLPINKGRRDLVTRVVTTYVQAKFSDRDKLTTADQQEILEARIKVGLAIDELDQATAIQKVEELGGQNKITIIANLGLKKFQENASSSLQEQYDQIKHNNDTKENKPDVQAVTEFFGEDTESKKMTTDELALSITHKFQELVKLQDKATVKGPVRFALFQSAVLAQSDVTNMTKEERSNLYETIEKETFGAENKRDSERYNSAKESLEQSIENRQQMMRKKQVAYFATAFEVFERSEKPELATKLKNAQTLLDSTEITEKEFAQLKIDYKSISVSTNEVTQEILNQANKAHRDKLIEEVFSTYKNAENRTFAELTEIDHYENNLKDQNLNDIGLSIVEGHFTLTFDGTNAGKNLARFTQAREHAQEGQGNLVDGEFLPAAAANIELDLIALDITNNDAAASLDHELSHLNRELIKQTQEKTIAGEIGRLVAKKYDKDKLTTNDNIPFHELGTLVAEYFNKDNRTEADLAKLPEPLHDYIKKITRDVKDDLTTSSGAINMLLDIYDTVTVKISEQDRILDEISSEIITWDPNKKLYIQNAGLKKPEDTANLKKGEFNGKNETHQATLTLIEFLNKNKAKFQEDETLKLLVSSILEDTILQLTPKSVETLMSQLEAFELESIAKNENIEYDETLHSDDTADEQAQDGNGWEFNSSDPRRYLSAKYEAFEKNSYGKRRGVAERWGGFLPFSDYRGQRGWGAVRKLRRGEQDDLTDEVDILLRTMGGRLSKTNWGKNLGTWFFTKILGLEKSQLKYKPYQKETLSLQRASGAEHVDAVRQGLMRLLQSEGLSPSQLLVVLDQIGVAEADYYRGNVEPKNSTWTTKTDNHRLNPALYYFLNSQGLNNQERNNIKYLIGNETLTPASPDGKTLGSTTSFTVKNPKYIKKGVMTDNLKNMLLQLVSEEGETGGGLSIEDRHTVAKGGRKAAKLIAKETKRINGFNETRTQFELMAQSMMREDGSSFNYINTAVGNERSNEGKGNHYTMEHLLRAIKKTDEINYSNMEDWDGKEIDPTKGEKHLLFTEKNKDGRRDADGNRTEVEAGNPRKYIWIGEKDPAHLERNRFLVEDARKFASYFMMARSAMVLQTGVHGDVGSVNIQKDNNGNTTFSFNQPVYVTEQSLVEEGYPIYTTEPRHAKVSTGADGKQTLVPALDPAAAMTQAEFKDFIEKDDKFEWLNDATIAVITTGIDDGEALKNFKLYAEGAPVMGENKTMNINIPIEAISRFGQDMMEDFFGKIDPAKGYVVNHSNSGLIFDYYDWKEEKAKSSFYWVEYQQRLKQIGMARSRAQNFEAMWGLLNNVSNVLTPLLYGVALWSGAPSMLLWLLVWSLVGSKIPRALEGKQGAMYDKSIEIGNQIEGEMEMWKKLGDTRLGTTELQTMVSHMKRIRALYGRIYKAKAESNREDFAENSVKTFFGGMGSFLTD